MKYEIEFWATLIIANVFFAANDLLLGSFWFIFATFLLIINLVNSRKDSIQKKITRLFLI